jgi:hypothetical protein
MSWFSQRAAPMCLAAGVLTSHLVCAQEASSGFDLRATLTGQMVASNELTEAPRSGSPVIAGSRSVIYPTWKFNDNWFVTGAFQLVTRPYYFAELSGAGYGAKGSVLQATLNYSQVFRDGSILVRAGQMSTAFGSFPLRYDDAENPLIDLPVGYGYYYAPVSIFGIAGLQIDATRGRWDGRVQFANSSPANPRSLFDHDQYGNWAGGAGYTIRQGFRVGASGYRGPFLDRKYPYYFPGEAKPSELPAHAAGIDVNWAHGHTNAQGEFQKFVMPYKAIPTFRETAGYGEVRQVMSPRWFIAGRYGYSSSNAVGKEQRIETSAGFRLFRFELIKVGYEIKHYSAGSGHDDHTFAVQFVTTLHASLGRE